MKRKESTEKPTPDPARQSFANNNSMGFANLVFLYTLFAVIATIVNISGQELCVRVYSGPYFLLISVFIGTLLGLACKYILDKRYIFKVQTQNLNEDSYLFLLYTSMGVLTTLIFWGTEFAFHYLFEDKYMRYVGAIIGLSIGYLIK